MWHGLEAVYVLPRMILGCRATHQSHHGGVERLPANYE